MIYPIEIKHIDNSIEGNAQYYTYLDGRLYWNNHNEFSTYCFKGNKQYKIFHKTLLTHNFTPFKWRGVYYGIGGQDFWKADKKWRGINFEEFKEIYQEHFEKPYTRGPKFYEVIKHKFDTTRTLPHCKGLYLFWSPDGINWQNKDLIITAKSPGFISALDWKSAEFDSKPCIVRYKDLFYLYLRANTSQDERQIQYSTSPDLLKWSEFKLIDCKFKKNENYYHPAIMDYRKQLIGFFSYYNRSKSCIKIMRSSDGEKWEFLKDIFVEKPFIIENSKRKMRVTADTILHNDKNAFLFVNHNYNGHNKNFRSYLINYKIPLRFIDELL